MPALKNTKPNPANFHGLPPEDPDHHLVLNRGFWWVCCSINATPRTKEKLGYSLRTKCLLTARLRRDVFFHGLQSEGLEVRLRRQSRVALAALSEVSPARLALPWKERVADVLVTALAANLDAGVAPEGAEPGPVSPATKRRPRRPALLASRP